MPGLFLRGQAQALCPNTKNRKSQQSHIKHDEVPYINHRQKWINPSERTYRLVKREDAPKFKPITKRTVSTSINTKVVSGLSPGLWKVEGHGQAKELLLGQTHVLPRDSGVSCTKVTFGYGLGIFPDLGCWDSDSRVLCFGMFGLESL